MKNKISTTATYLPKNRRILLLEPNYRNKYPPMGLMKIATYHRMLGDHVTFFKGNLRDFVFERVYLKCLQQLKNIDSSIIWEKQQAPIKAYIKKKTEDLFDNCDFVSSPYQSLIKNALHYFRDYWLKNKYLHEQEWDRVYVTSLFTFHWKITVETVNFAKTLVKNPIEDVKVGGIAASLLPELMEKETGIKPIIGLLNQTGILDSDNNIIIDELPLDYSILYEIDYEYPAGSAYFTFMTKGCPRECAFCAVPKLEPNYVHQVPTLDKFSQVKRVYGEQQNLLLLDNNVLESNKFPEIIAEIKAMGFVKGATFIEPNQLDIAIKNLQQGTNDRGYTKFAFKLIHAMSNRLKGDIAQKYQEILRVHDLSVLESTTKAELIAAYPKIADIYERHRNKAAKQRFVDFNQGTDARSINEENMRLMSEIAIRPLRIAFDHLGMKKQYTRAVRLAAKYGISELSNYLLYNYTDKPRHLYHRLKINQELCLELDLHIYSFPMKYIPNEPEPQARNFIGKHWNRKFIRAIQCILNVTRGIVAPARNNEKGSFFEAAFGKNQEEFEEILYMPETYIMYRALFEKKLGYAQQWRSSFRNLAVHELKEAKIIIENNDFCQIEEKTTNPKIQGLLKHYVISRRDIKIADDEHYNIKLRYDDLIQRDQLLNLTLTQEFDAA